MATANMHYPPDKIPEPLTYRQAAEKGFDLLAAQYTQKPDVFDGNFWFGGNALHACLNYLITAKKRDTKGILQAGYAIYNRLKGRPFWWKDDYAWWGIAFTEALASRNDLEDGPHEKNDKLYGNVQTAAQECWDELVLNWNKDMPYSRTADNANDSADDIRGGVFNSLDSGDDLKGRNSVTNESFWILSQRLARLFPTETKYSDAATAQHDWFVEWLKFPATHPGKIGILTAGGLVSERPTGSPHCKGWYWTGDQGLFINGLSPTDRQTAYTIASNVMTKMKDDDGVLHEFMTNYPMNHISDYATGKGIFMRNLVPLIQGNPAPKGYADAVKFITTNASAIWRHQSAPNQFTFNWNPKNPEDAKEEPTILSVPPNPEMPYLKQLCNLIMQASAQDALTAALAVAPDEKID
ncbi:MAG TPA: hypothetical protein VK722_02605 [Candidatus Aquilonibacter sp.]|jgi:hypothetical protein|nr:hypothetical protein [Candidatus Aquilonibacter sp.]